MEVAVFISVLFILYFFLIFPRIGRRKDTQYIRNRDIAHRGLYNAKGAPENSLAAVRLATQSGYAMEIDVHMTKDERIVVFHDSDTLRMCGIKKVIQDEPYEELKALTLSDTQQKIPLLEDVLKEIDGRVPLIVEIKSDHLCMRIAKRVHEVLSAYSGKVIVESFNPFVLLWFRLHEPGYLRAQATCIHYSKKRYFVLRYLIANCLSRPDIIIHEKNMNNLSMMILRKLNIPMICFTLTAPEEHALLRDSSDGYIFEGYIPERREI